MPTQLRSNGFTYRYIRVRVGNNRMNITYLKELGAAQCLESYCAPGLGKWPEYRIAEKVGEILGVLKQDHSLIEVAYNK